MKVLFGSYLDYFVIVLFGMVWRVVPEWYLSCSGNLQVLPLSGRNPNYGVEPPRGGKPLQRGLARG